MKDDLVYMGHMLDFAIRAVEKLKGKNRKNFDEDENLRLALTHLIQVIGESASRVSERTQQIYPDIPWMEVIGMRHRIVHDYLHIKYDIVWQVVTKNLPTLIPELMKIVPQNHE